MLIDQFREDSDAYQIYDEFSTTPLKDLLFDVKRVITWVQIGNVFVLVDITNERAWGALVSRLYASGKYHRFVIVSGRHGDMRGGFDPAGSILPDHANPEFQEADDKKAGELRTSLGNGAVIERPVKDAGPLNMAGLKNMVQAASDVADTAVVFCFCNALTVFRTLDVAAERALFDGKVANARAQIEARERAKNPNAKVYPKWLDDKARAEVDPQYKLYEQGKIDEVEKISVKEAVRSYWSWYRRPRSKVQAISARLRSLGVA